MEQTIFGGKFTHFGERTERIIETKFEQQNQRTTIMAANQQLTDEQVKQQLRSLKEPICLFGEDIKTRRERLSRILGAKTNSSANIKKTAAKNILSTANSDDDSSSDSDSNEDNEEQKRRDQELQLLKPEHQKRLMDLRRRMNQCKNQNLQDVVQEHQLHQFLDKRRKRVDEENAQRRRKGQEQLLFTGDRLPHFKSKKRMREEQVSLDISAEKSQRILDTEKAKVFNQLEHEQDANVAAYNKRAKNIPARLTEAYHLAGAVGANGETEFSTYGSSSSAAASIPEENKQLLAKELENSRIKNSEYSRRRTFDEADDVDYINEHNRLFNKKASRIYDPYTVEIKQNLERGTAL